MVPSPPAVASTRARMALAAVVSSECLVPIGLRLAHPSLYSDDVVRIAHLQTLPLRALLFRPFNEHMAPLFEVVSWVVWNLAGRRLTAAPLAFTLASFVPFLIALAMLGRVVRRETGSGSASIAAVLLFALSSVASETIYWYSASSFTWALVGTLAALDCAGRAAESTGRARLGWLIGSLLASAAAPAFSAIGLLAGPTAALRTAASRRARAPIASAGSGPLGTLIYLAVCSLFHYRDVLGDSLGRHVVVGRAVRNVMCAPVDVLLPGLLGLGSVEARLADPLAIGLASALAVAVFLWAARDTRRGIIAAGMGLILGGYALTFGVRSDPGSGVILDLQRYQLFPHLGLVLLIAAGARRIWLSLDASPRRLAWVAALAVTLAAVHLREMQARARYLHFPDQARTLAALDRLATIARREGITREQALRALDPIRTRWFDHDFNALMMTAQAATTPKRPDAEVRRTLLAALDPGEREALCGGMDASPYLRSVDDRTGRLVAEGRLSKAIGLIPDGPNRWISAGWPALLEYELAGRPAEASVLSLKSGSAVELWWSDRPGGWSQTRSVRWNPGPSAAPREWAVPLERLPHWDRSRAKWLRVAIREPGTIEAGAPRLLR